MRDYTTKNLVQLVKTNSRILSFLALSRLFEQKSLVIRTEGGRREKVLELPSDRRHGSRDCLHPNAVIERTAADHGVQLCIVEQADGLVVAI
jgi:hypothetical protein